MNRLFFLYPLSFLISYSPNTRIYIPHAICISLICPSRELSTHRRVTMSGIYVNPAGSAARISELRRARACIYLRRIIARARAWIYMYRCGCMENYMYKRGVVDINLCRYANSSGFSLIRGKLTRLEVGRRLTLSRMLAREWKIVVRRGGAGIP